MLQNRVSFTTLQSSARCLGPSLLPTTPCPFNPFSCHHSLVISTPPQMPSSFLPLPTLSPTPLGLF